MDDLRVALDPTAWVEMKESAEGASNSHLVYLVPISLIPNSDGTFQPDWIVTGGGIVEPNLADFWVSAQFLGPPV